MKWSCKMSSKYKVRVRLGFLQMRLIGWIFCSLAGIWIAGWLSGRGFWLAGWLAVLPAGWLACRLAGRLVGKLHDCLASWLVGWLVGLPAG
jgi:hypothetical protein